MIQTKISDTVLIQILPFRARPINKTFAVATHNQSRLEDGAWNMISFCQDIQHEFQTQSLLRRDQTEEIELNERLREMFKEMLLVLESVRQGLLAGDQTP